MKKIMIIFCAAAILAASAATAFCGEKESLERRLSIENDKVENIQRIYDQSSPRDIDGDTFYLYIAKRAGRAVPRLVAGFVKKDEILFKSMVINIDGAIYEITAKNPRDIYAEVLTAAKVKESANIPAKPFMNILKHAAGGKKTVVRFKGRHEDYDIVLTKKQKAALDRVIRYYELINTEDDSTAELK